jgi:sporulation protein YlmC with PRC-barrel domain
MRRGQAMGSALFLFLGLALASLAAAGGELVQADALIGKTVKSPDGEALGRIRDLVVDLDDNRVRYAIVEAQERLFRYSLAQFDPSRDGDHVVFYVAKGRLQDSRGMDPDWEGFGVVRTSELLGRQIRDRDGRRIGELTGLAIDWVDGSVPFAVADLDSDAGPGTRVRLGAFSIRGEALVLER